MSFPYSYSVLGLVPGLILTVVVAGLVLYTSLVVVSTPFLISLFTTLGVCFYGGPDKFHLFPKYLALTVSNDNY